MWALTRLCIFKSEVYSNKSAVLVIDVAL